MKWLAFAASHRPDSRNRQLLLGATRYIQQADAMSHISLVDYEAFDMPLFNDYQRELEGMPDCAEDIRAHFAEADTLLIAMPEYNWSYPASLKNIIDWMSCYRPKFLTGKTAFLMCATPSERGGMQGLAHLKTALEAVGILVYPTMYGLGNVTSVLQEGIITDTIKLAQLHTQLNEFITYATRLKL